METRNAGTSNPETHLVVTRNRETRIVPVPVPVPDFGMVGLGKVGGSMIVVVISWILEFLINQNTLDDETLNNLIHILPLPNNNPRLKKSLILRKFDSDIKTGPISDHTLDLLESILELDISQHVFNPSEALKLAYGTLAMYCTIKSIENDDIEAKCDSLKRVWSERVREMEGCDNVRYEMLSWVKDIEARIMEVDVCENVLVMFEELDVGEVLSRYVSEAREMMGPSFIEVACEVVLSDPGLSKELGLDGGVSGRDLDVDVHSEDNEASRAPVLPKNKQISHRGAKIVDPMETSHDQCDGIPTPEVDRVKEALEKSSSELNAEVKDPLSKALRYTESLNVNTSGENMARDHDVGGSTKNNDEQISDISHGRSGTHRGAKIVDPMETSHYQCDGIPTPEVDRVKEALEKSSSELNAVDPSIRGGASFGQGLFFHYLGDGVDIRSPNVVVQSRPRGFLICLVGRESHCDSTAQAQRPGTIDSLKFVLTQPALDALCENYHIPDAVHRQLPGRHDKIGSSPTGKIEMDLFAFIRYADPTKVKGAGNDEVNEGALVADQPKKINKKRKVTDGGGGSSYAPKKLREDYGTSGGAGASVAGKYLVSLQGLLERSTLAAEVGVTTVAIVPFVTSFVTPTPKHEGGGGEDSATGPIIRTRPAPERFVVLIDSSYYSGTNAADDEVTSIVRSPVPPPPILTMAVTTTVEAEAAEAIRLRDQIMAVEAAEANRITELHSLRERNVSLEGQIAALESAVVRKDAEIAYFQSQVAKLTHDLSSLQLSCDELSAKAYSLKFEKDKLVTCSGLRDEVMGYKFFKERVEEMHDEQMGVLSDRVAAIDSDLMDMVLHMDAGFYPHYLTTIARRRWILSRGLRLVLAKCLASPKYLSALGEAIGRAIEKARRRWILSRGLRLVLAKCLASPKYLSALGEAIGRAIEKGMQDGLTSGIEHGRAGRSIADVLAFNPFSEGDCIAAINALRDVNFSLLAQLEANMDSSMADIMDLLRLEGPAVEAFGASQLEW
nr:homeodomain-like protein [Tanacetum cinerariifolium]